MKLLLIVSIILCCNLGCSKPDEIRAQDGVSVENTDPETGVVVRVETSDDIVGLADRIQVRINILWSPPTSARLVDPDFESYGWVVVLSAETPARIHDDVYLTQYMFTLEPFLPGEYQVPAITVALNESHAGEVIELSTMPIPIVVDSALTEGASAQLSPYIEMIDSSVLPQEKSGKYEVSVLAASIAAIIVSLLFLLIFRLKYASGVQPMKRESVQSLLQEVAVSTQEDGMRNFHMLHQALLLLDSGLQGTSEIQSFVRECERVQYSNEPQFDVLPTTMARHTLELLGQWEEGVA